jgi:hypothetical protein
VLSWGHALILHTHDGRVCLSVQQSAALCFKFFYLLKSQPGLETSCRWKNPHRRPVKASATFLVRVPQRCAECTACLRIGFSCIGLGWALRWGKRHQRHGQLPVFGAATVFTRGERVINSISTMVLCIDVPEYLCAVVGGWSDIWRPSGRRANVVWCVGCVRISASAATNAQLAECRSWGAPARVVFVPVPMSSGLRLFG